MWLRVGLRGAMVGLLAGAILCVFGIAAAGGGGGCAVAGAASSATIAWLLLVAFMLRLRRRD